MIYVPYNPARDPMAHLTQGLENMLGGILQREQQKRVTERLSQDIQSLQNIAGAQQIRQDIPFMPSPTGRPMMTMQPPTPRFQTPQIAQMYAQQLIGNILRPQLNPLQLSQIELNLARAEALKTDKSKTAELMREGYTQEQAKHILDIFHGLKPRASAATRLENKSLPEQLSFWQTVYNKTLDPVWGYQQPTADMEAARGLAKDNIDRIIGFMRTERGVITEPRAVTPSVEPWQLQGMTTPGMLEGTLPGGYIPEEPTRALPRAEARLTDSQIVNRIAKMKVDDKFISPTKAHEIARKYPTLSRYLLELNPEEQEEVLSAITAGMTEAEILKFFK